MILPNYSDYRRKRRKNNNHWENDLIKLCAHLTAKLLTTMYKSKIIRFLMNEDPLQRRIYFLTFVESLEMIFSQYTEPCEVITDDPKIGRIMQKNQLEIFCMQILVYTTEYGLISSQ